MRLRAARTVANVLALGVVLASVHCGSSSEGDAVPTTSTDAGTDGSGPGGCDPSTDATCVTNEVGVFVDGAGGNDANAGTKESPFKTIGGALKKLGGKSRVFVCEGTYAEQVKVTSAVGLYGGFACSGWSYTGTKSKVAPLDAGYALAIEKVSGAVAVTDLAFEAAAGTAGAVSSIAALVNGSSSVTFTRVELKANAGFKGEDPPKAGTGTLMSSTPTAGTLNGNNANVNVGGFAQTCTCSTGGTSKGGGGGNSGGDGSPGEVAQTVVQPSGATGAGSTVAECGGGQGGRPGSNAPPAAAGPAVMKVGELAGAAWTSRVGTAGAAGTPGQGGGGGGGSGGGGGGGGCGGCGGEGGKGGGGGGASLALLSIDSTVTFVSSSLTSANGGAGGKGGPGGDGGAGGVKGARGGAACDGGNGGTGGAGGAGSGGAGGLSVGVLYKGTKPTLDAATEGAITIGAPGPKGVGGAAGVNDGPVGIAAKVQDVTTL